MSLAAFRISDEAVVNAPHGPDNVPHFLGQTIHMLSRLRDHVERLDRGVAYVEDDIAVILRAMLYHTRGNRVLDRLRQLYGLDGIDVRLSRRPTTVDTDLHLSLGSLPSSSTAGDDGSEWVPIQNWASRACVRLRANGKIQKYTWGEFLNDYANKWGGAHIDREVPSGLRAMEMFEAGGFALPGYLLRTAAVQCWLIGQAVLGMVLPLPESLKAQLGEAASGRRLIGGEGSITEEPADFRGRGELQWIDYRTYDVDFLLYVTHDQPASLRMQPGALGYRLDYLPSAV